MHNIEPFYRWLKLYCSEEDIKSPFFGRQYGGLEYINTIYNYYIHPLWDEFGSETLYLKILFADYKLGYAIIELFGEWNDTLYNDIMFLKRQVADKLIANGINKFILIGENVFNFHSSDDLYYEEWFGDVEEGWILGLNFREHVIQEFLIENIHYYINFDLLNFNWRAFNPYKLCQIIDESRVKRIG